MHVSVITPAAAVVSWEEAKGHLRLDTTTDQSLVEALVAAATDWLGRAPEGWLQRAVGSQTLEARFRLFPANGIELPFGPVTSISSIKYLDEDGTEQTTPNAVYQRLSDGRVVLNVDEEWPDLYDDEEAVRVRYVAGDTPAAIKAAILLIVSFLYENREASPEDALSVGAVKWLLAPYRVFA